MNENDLSFFMKDLNKPMHLQEREEHVVDDELMDISDVVDAIAQDPDRLFQRSDEDTENVPEHTPTESTAPILLDIYDNHELNEFLVDFMRVYTKGRMIRSAAVGMWNLFKKYSKFDPLAMKSFDTMERKLKNSMPQATVHWKIRRTSDGKIFHGKGKSVPFKRFKDKKKYELLLVWTRLSLMDLIRYHAGKHPHAHFMDTGKINYKKVKLSFTFDGIPNGKSSPDNLHVMGIRFKGCKTVYIPQVRIARRKEVKDVSRFMDPFVDEVNKLGCQVQYFIADAPMRALIKCLKAHAGNYSCEVCEARGECVLRKICYPLSMINQVRRTQELWRERVDDLMEQRVHGPINNVKGITGASPLLRLRNFDMIKNCPSDPLHRDWLGIVKSTLWKSTVGMSKGGTMNARGRQVCNEISDVYEAICLPSEFSHRSRAIDYANFKGHEWKSLTMTTFPNIAEITKLQLGENMATIWLMYVFLVLVYNSPAWVFHELGMDFLKEYHQILYELFENEFGKSSCTFNWHNFHHMPEMRVCSRTTDMSTEAFESAYGKVQTSYAPGTRSIGVQITKNMLLRTINHVEGTHCNHELAIAPYKAPLTVDDSWLIDDSFNYYKVHAVHGDKVTVLPIKRKKWSCPQDPTIPFHLVGVYKFDGYHDETVDLTRDTFQGKAILTKDELLLPLPWDLLFS